MSSGRAARWFGRQWESPGAFPLPAGACPPLLGGQGEIMRKSDRVEARRALLQSALIALREAQATKTVHRVRAELDGDALDYGLIKGHELPYLTPDVWRVLIGGIERALQGDPDPFRLNLAGRKPRIDSSDIVEAVAGVLRAERRGVPRGDAIAIISGESGISVGLLRKALKDPDTLEQARILVGSYSPRLKALMNAAKQFTRQE